MWKLMLAALVAALGCIRPDLVMCADGLACPAGDRCDDVHHGCVAPGQLTACTGLVDRTDCTAGPVSGGCFDGVCLARGCGNRVVEAGEMCDDGNQISGDGCSGDCQSTEQCGNGVADPGEQCDDGNLVSRDGCDSRCRVETAAWRAVPIAPFYIDARKTAYDAARGRLVHVSTDGSTWEWDGTRWTVAATSIGAAAVFRDPDRGGVDLLGSDPSGLMHVYAWRDGAWTAIPGTDGPVHGDADTLEGLTAAYDAIGHRLFVVETHGRVFPLDAGPLEPDTGRAWVMDTTGVWTELPDLPARLYDAVSAFDPAAAQLVLEDDTGTEWIYDGTAWSSAVSGFGKQVSLIVNPDRGGLVLVDGQSQQTYERVDAAWTAIPDSAVPCGSGTEYRPFYYDDAAGALTLFSTDSSKVCAWHSGWTARVPALPFRPVGATYDPITRSLVVLHDARPSDPAAGIESWRLTDGGWERIATPHAPSGRDATLAIYSSGRAATVLYGGATADGRIADTWAFDGEDWSLTAQSRDDTADSTARAATYDATHDRVVMMVGDAWWSLPDGGGAWQPVDVPNLDGYVAAIAWDARNATLVATGQLGIGGSPLFELRPGGWTALDLIPGDLNPIYPTTVMSDPRSGGVLAFNLGTGATWQRLGAEWTRLPAAPVQQAIEAWTAYDPAAGRVLYVANALSGMLAAVMTRTSPTPLESCRPGEDIDGDGLAGCDDPDCYWACSRSSPYTAR